MTDVPTGGGVICGVGIAIRQVGIPWRHIVASRKIFELVTNKAIRVKVILHGGEPILCGVEHDIRTMSSDVKDGLGGNPQGEVEDEGAYLLRTNLKDESQHSLATLNQGRRCPSCFRNWVLRFQVDRRQKSPSA